MRSTFVSIAAAGLGVFAANTPATVLTFDQFLTGNPAVPADYGDRVLSSPDPITGYLYDPGRAFTPNIVVDYLPDSALNGTFDIWNGYGSLNRALGDNNFTVPGRVVLTADEGFEVVLNGFDIAPWSSTVPNAFVSVTDGNGVVLFSQTYSANPEVNTPIRFPNGLRGRQLNIRMNNFGDWAMDNIDFFQSGRPCNFADVADLTGELDINDVLVFATAFSNQDPIADVFGADGVFDINDVLTFAFAFNTGCP